MVGISRWREPLSGDAGFSGSFGPSRAIKVSHRAWNRQLARRLGERMIIRSPKASEVDQGKQSSTRENRKNKPIRRVQDRQKMPNEAK